MIFNKEDKIVFFGDSITWAGKLKESGEGAPANHPFGNGYVTLLNAYFTIHYPELNLRLINKGISGNRTIDLIDRMDEDVLSLRPNYLFVMIGVNDAWRQFDTVQVRELIIKDSEYEHNLEIIIKRALDNNVRVVLLTPFIVELNKKDPLREKLDIYGEIVHKLGEKYQLIVVDTQKAFDKVLKKITPYVMTNDRIHVNFTGHMIIMEEVLKAIK